MGVPQNALAFLVLIVAFLCLLLIILIVRILRASRRLSQDASGDSTTFMAVAMQDAVTRMRDQERALEARAEASERLSDQIIDSLPSGLLVTNRAGVPTRINPAAARLLGVRDDEVVAAAFDPSTLWTELGPAGAGVRALVEECLSNGSAVLRRTIVIEDRAAPGGATRTRHLGAGVSPLVGPRGELAGAICLFTDLTAVVDLEEQLRLKDSLGRLGELTAGLAHEFRNGLATIHGYAWLMEPEKLPEDHRRYVESLRDETESLSEIVANFLAFAKPSAHSAQVVPLGPIVTRAVDDLKSEAAALGGSITIEGDFADVDGDDVMLRQAVSNLVRNAIEACEGAGRVPLVQVRGVVDRATDVQCLFVADNGPGVPAEAADKVFRPFFTTRGRGTGLGLALVQKIIVSHNGRVTLGVSQSGGAEFAIVLPLASRRT